MLATTHAVVLHLMVKLSLERKLVSERVLVRTVLTTHRGALRLEKAAVQEIGHARILEERDLLPRKQRPVTGMRHALLLHTMVRPS